MIFSRIKYLLDKFGISNPNFIFLLALAFFTADSAVNMFWDIPVFVPFIIVILPLMWANLMIEKRLAIFFLLFCLVFGTTFIITGFIHGWHRQSLSDLLFILFFITSFYYYKAYHAKVSIKYVHVFVLVILLMFSFTFVGINSISYSYGNDGTDQTEIRTQKKVKHDSDSLDVLEYLRDYKYGLFRIPHIATYMLGFTGMFYAFFFFRKRTWYLAVISGLTFLLMFYSGVRTFFAAMMLAVVIFFFRRKTLWALLTFGLMGLLIVIFRYQFYSITRDTLLEPFSSLIITLTDNIDRLSRILIWKSWWLEMKSFHWYDWLLGKSYYESIEANIENLHQAIWFHNDFFSIVFSYGIIATVLYVLIFVKIYRAFARQIRGNFFVFLFFVTLPVAAFINGMYYYFPVFVLYLFFVMLSQEKNLASAD